MAVFELLAVPAVNKGIQPWSKHDRLLRDGSSHAAPPLDPESSFILCFLLGRRGEGLLDGQGCCTKALHPEETGMRNLVLCDKLTFDTHC